jgi:hypothetical protein
MKQTVDLAIALNEAHPEALDAALHKIFASSPGEALAVFPNGAASDAEFSGG